METREAQFEDLLGKTLSKIENKDNEILKFICEDGAIFEQYHEQDCCEYVAIEDICGDLDDLIGLRVLLAEEIIHEQNETPEGVINPEFMDESFLWTFYKLATNRGAVTVRWCGSSNGYYSERVTFRKL